MDVRGADWDSGHYLVSIKFRYKLTRFNTSCALIKIKYDVKKLKNVEIKDSYRQDIKNRCVVGNELPTGAIDDRYTKSKEIVGKAAEKLLDMKKKIE